jgi:hypothetical protein
MASFAEWAAAVAGAGLVAGIVVLAGIAAASWLLVRRVRRRVEFFYEPVGSRGRRAATIAFARTNSPEAR